MGKHPVIDTGRCSDCETCMELCPAVFKRNRATGVIEVVDLSEYPEEEIDEAIGYCPEDCLSWETKES
ncbi:MAG: ferredoxin [Desulfatiglans sp.]|nr:ferredoxin [Desulfatiglans sp.]